MFCRHCGARIPSGSNYCPGCGARNDDSDKSPEYHILMKAAERRRLLAVIGVAMLLGICVFGRSCLAEQKSHTNSSGFAKEASMAEQEAPSIIGVWKCEQREVTFMENGNMMLGKDGIVLGGGWVQYEIVDEETLYISGGDLPVGMNIEYTLSDGYLALKMNGGAVMFTKE